MKVFLTFDEGDIATCFLKCITCEHFYRPFPATTASVERSTHYPPPPPRPLEKFSLCYRAFPENKNPDYANSYRSTTSESPVSDTLHSLANNTFSEILTEKDKLFRVQLGTLKHVDIVNKISRSGWASDIFGRVESSSVACSSSVLTSIPNCIAFNWVFHFDSPRTEKNSPSC